jgi:hypothetical protein
MEQSTIDKLGLATKIFGAVLFVVLLAGMIWSLTQPPVTEGPMPDPFVPKQIAPN